MYNWIRARLIAALRLPPAPHPPAGRPESVRVFRAGENFYRILLVGWGLAQAATLAGIIFSIALLYSLKDEVERLLADDEPAAAAEASGQGEPNREFTWKDHAAAWIAPHARWAFPLVTVVEAGGLVVYVLQLIATGVVVRLEYELRWYMVTDRSLRIRSGVWRLKEATMSFANLQQVELSQGPVQRLLGIADVRVSSAGGGGGRSEQEGGSHVDSLHTGVFHGVTNATEIRDLILARLREFREAGLGDPEDESRHAPAVATSQGADRSEVLAAARELLEAARELTGNTGTKAGA